MKFVLGENWRNPKKIYPHPILSIMKSTLSEGDGNSGPQRWEASNLTACKHGSAKTSKYMFNAQTILI